MVVLINLNKALLSNFICLFFFFGPMNPNVGFSRGLFDGLMAGSGLV